MFFWNEFIDHSYSQNHQFHSVWLETIKIARGIQHISTYLEWYLVKKKKRRENETRSSQKRTSFCLYNKCALYARQQLPKLKSVKFSHHALVICWSLALVRLCFCYGLSPEFSSHCRHLTEKWFHTEHLLDNFNQNDWWKLRNAIR